MKEENNDTIWEHLAGQIHNELSPEEKSDLRSRMKQEANSRLKDEMDSLHEKLKKAEPLYHFSAERSWQKVTGYFRMKRLNLVYTFSKYAAIILLTLFIATLFSPRKEEKKQTLTEFFVPLGQMSQLTLSDGTQVWLNSGTTLRYGNNFGDEMREVSLNGEAFFKVKPDKIPFKVKLKNSEVVVLGTSFNVVSFYKEKSSEITLVEGKVKINSLAGSEIAQMKPSQQLILSNDLKNNTLKTVETGFYVSWTDGKIVFEEERLADIAERLERWYNVEINFSDVKTGEYRFSGTILKNKPFEQITKAFELLLPVRITYTRNLDKKDIIFISKK